MILKLHLARTNGTKFFSGEIGSYYIIEDKMLERYVWFVLNFVPGKFGIYFQISILRRAAEDALRG